jgi:hypothetical protein
LNAARRRTRTGARSDTAKPVKKTPQAFAEVEKIDRSGKNGSVGGFQFSGHGRKVIINDTAVFGLTDTPAVFFALAAPFEFEFGQEDNF